MESPHDLRPHPPRDVRPRPTRPRSLGARLRDQAGEGVISTGIVVLIMALIGAAMWVAFSSTANDAAERVDEAVQEIGSDGG